MADLEKSSPKKVPPPSGSPLKVSEQPGVNERETEMTKELALDTTKPLAAPQDPTKDKKVSRMEIFLASLPILAKGDPKGVEQGSSEAAV